MLGWFLIPWTPLSWDLGFVTRNSNMETIHGQLSEQKPASGATEIYFKSREERQGLLPTGLFGLWTLLEHSLPALNISAVPEIKVRLLCSISE